MQKNTTRSPQFIGVSLLATTAALSAGAVHAANFTIASPSTTAQTRNAAETGTIQSTGSLTIGGSTNSVTIAGNNATLTNLGILSQTGTGRAIRDNTVSTTSQPGSCRLGTPMQCARA